MVNMNPSTDAACQIFAQAMAEALVAEMRVELIFNFSYESGCNAWSESGVFDAVYDHVSTLDPASLGMLAASGGGRNFDDENEWSSDGYTELVNYYVHSGSYSNKYASGWTNLRTLATTALVARMYQIIPAAQDRLIADFSQVG